jgi:hypothetical protein
VILLCVLIGGNGNNIARAVAQRVINYKRKTRPHSGEKRGDSHSKYYFLRLGVHSARYIEIRNIYHNIKTIISTSLQNSFQFSS